MFGDFNHDYGVNFAAQSNGDMPVWMMREQEKRFQTQFKELDASATLDDMPDEFDLQDLIFD